MRPIVASLDAVTPVRGIDTMTGRPAQKIRLEVCAAGEG
jgi:hypothetical protein